MTGVVKRVALAIGWRRQLARMRFCLAATSAAAAAKLTIGPVSYTHLRAHET